MPSYSTLVTDIKNTSEVDSTEFDNQIDNFITKAEYRLIKELDDFGLDVITTVTAAVGNPLLNVASDIRVVRNVNITNSDSERVNLLRRTSEYIYDYWPVVASTAEPKYYTLRMSSNSSETTAIYLAPTPDSTYSTEVTYVTKPSALTSVNPNNYFSDYCYNALFYACMLEASLYLKSFNTVAIWQGELKNAIDGLRNQARRTRQDDMQNNTSPAGSADTVIQGSS